MENIGVFVLISICDKFFGRDMLSLNILLKYMTRLSDIKYKLGHWSRHWHLYI